MTDKDLLHRVEEQAAEIAALKSEVERLRTALDIAPDQARDSLILAMRRTAVNCGRRSSCPWPVGSRPARKKKRKNDRFSVFLLLLLFLGHNMANRSEIEVLSVAEQAQLLREAEAAFGAANSKAKRRRAAQDLAMIQTSLYTGASGPELCHIRVADVDLVKGFITLRFLRRSRRVPIHAKLSPVLRGCVAIAQGRWLFRGPGGGRASQRTFRRRLAALGETAGISKPVYPHLLRYTFAKSAMETGAINAAQVRKLLGIDNLDPMIAHLGCDQDDLLKLINCLPEVTPGRQLVAGRGEGTCPPPAGDLKRTETHGNERNQRDRLPHADRGLPRC